MSHNLESSVMECIGRREEVDKNGKEYIRLFFTNWSFQTRTNPATGEIVFVKEHSHVGNTNQYPESYTSSKRPDPYYRTQVGEMVTGMVVQRKVQPYTTAKGFTVDYYNAVVFGDSTMSDWESRVRREFEKNGVSLLPDHTHKSFEITEDKTEDKTENKIKPEDREKIVEQLKSQETDIKEEDINF